MTSKRNDDWELIGARAERLGLLSGDVLRIAKAPVYREKPGVIKSLHATAVHKVELNCGHMNDFIDPRPLKGSLVFCPRCDDFFKVISGSAKATFRNLGGKTGPRNLTKVLTTFECAVCEKEFKHMYCNGRKPKYCPPCRKKVNNGNHKEYKRRWDARLKEALGR